MTKATTLRIAALLLLAGAVTALVIFRAEVQEELEAFLEWVRNLERWQGAVLIAAIYIPACVFFIPGSLITLGAGYALGVVWGTIAVSAGSVTGAAAAFLAGRFLVRDWIESRVARNPRFNAIDQAVGQQGFKIVLLTRLSPAFPFTLLNYAYGLTKVRFRDYFFASWIGMLPGTIMYVYLGSLAGSLASVATGQGKRTTAEWVLYGVGLAATVAVTIYVTRVAKKALDSAIAETKNEQDGSPP
jgi:uncharacterized membrane protein YdjX (TVP38/TMEM64 family)